jgi:hypothetical protein
LKHAAVTAVDLAGRPHIRGLQDTDTDRLLDQHMAAMIKCEPQGLNAASVRWRC